MHKLIVKEVKNYERWIINLKDRDKVCYQLDIVKEEVEKLQGVSSLCFLPYSYAIEVTVLIDHTKRIESVLRVFCKHFGKIRVRNVVPENKCFKFSFSGDIRLVIDLIGSSCKRVIVGSKEVKVDIYELRCDNGEEKAVTDIEISKELIEEPEG